MLAIDGLEVEYGGFQVLWGVDVTVQAGRIVALLGPNGAGKSTVLNAVSGFAPRTAGSVSFCGERIERLPTHRIVARGLQRRHDIGPKETGAAGYKYFHGALASLIR